jgi:hypothetical protein
LDLFGFIRPNWDFSMDYNESKPKKSSCSPPLSWLSARLTRRPEQGTTLSDFCKLDSTLCEIRQLGAEAGFS